MNEALEYVIAVVVLPALIGAAVSVPFVLKPFRRRAAMLEAGAAAAVCLAFLLSFARELDWNAVLRQVVAIEGDSAPFERWHRVGLAAAVLVVAAGVIAVLRARLGLGRVVTIACALGAAVAAAVFVEFPQGSTRVQVAQGVLVLATILGYGFAGGAVLWSAWVVFGALAVLSGLGGFASLAVMCGAASMCAFIVATLSALGGRLDRSAAPLVPGGAVVVCLGALTALVARCGMAYATTGVPAWTWILVALVPAGGALFASRSSKAIRPGAKTFWHFAGIALAAVAVLGAALLVDSLLKPKKDDGGAGDELDMYGMVAANDPVERA